MINLNGLNQYVAFVIGVLLIGVYFWMLTDRVSRRIRNSKYWYVGWLGALFILSTGGKLVLPVFNRAIDGTGLSDEQIIPVMFGTMILLIVIVFTFQIRKLRRA